MHISWSDAARRDLIAIVRFIERDNPHAAATTLRKIREAVEALVDQPGLGRRVNHTRELVVDRSETMALQMLPLQAAWSRPLIPGKGQFR